MILRNDGRPLERNYRRIEAQVNVLGTIAGHHTPMPGKVIHNMRQDAAFLLPESHKVTTGIFSDPPYRFANRRLPEVIKNLGSLGEGGFRHG